MKTQHKKGVLVIFAVFTILVLMTLPSAAQEKPKRGGTITIGHDADAVGLDPHLAIAFASKHFFEYVYTGLLRYNYKMELEPDLATSWEHPDDLTFIFHLRKGVKFHNGEEMTSDDVKFSFERMKDPKTASPWKFIYDAVSSVETPDRYTVKFKLAYPYPAFLVYLGDVRYSAIVSKKEVLKRGNLQSVMIGTGPFKLSEYLPGDQARYVRNDSYYERGLPYLDGFTLKVIKDESSRLAAIRKGTVELTWIKEIQLAELARKDKDITIAKTLPSRHLHLFFNTSKGPLSHVKARQAIASALDRQEFIDTILLGQGVLSTCIPPSTVPYVISDQETKNLPFYKQDYELSKKLLKEAGYPEGFEFTIKTSTHSPDYVPSAQIIQSQLAKVGIKVKIEQQEWGVLLKAFRANDFEAMIFANVWYPDPDGYIYSWLYSKSSENMGGFKSERIDRLLDLQRKTMDLKKRIQIWRDIQVALAEEIPIIWIYAMPQRIEMYRSNVMGYHAMPNTSRIYVREVWLK
jgi:peptide/nickel transport system substrate-binding protein